MSRRSSRRPPKKALYLSASVTIGIASLVEGNESIIASMLSVDITNNNDSSPDADDEIKTKLITSLTDCMSTNNLSVEALLARFFDVLVLQKYCEIRLGVSSKGNVATLAARVARAWSRANFQPLPLLKEEASASDCNEKDSTKSSSSTLEGEIIIKKTKKRTMQKKGSGNKETKKQKRVCVSPQRKPSYTITAPPGIPLGLTIKQYSDEFIVEDISPSCAIPETQGTFPKVNQGDVVTAIDGITINSQIKDTLKETSDKPRILTIGEYTIGRNAADHSKGSLLWMKEAGVAMFRIMDYSDVAEKYGQDFLEELDPQDKGRKRASTS